MAPQRPQLAIHGPRVNPWSQGEHLTLGWFTMVKGAFEGYRGPLGDHACLKLVIFVYYSKFMYRTEL